MKRILVCFDTDPQPSVFDGVVALDAGVDCLLRHGGVRPEDVRDLVHGAMFTRDVDHLSHTALFIGGSNVAAAESLLTAVRDVFFGPLRVSVMLDPNGANTTAAAAVEVAGKHVPLAPELNAVVLGATGPVGQRVVRLLALHGVEVRVTSRRLAHAEALCHRLTGEIAGARLAPFATDLSNVDAAIEGKQLVVSAAAAGIEMMTDATRRAAKSLRVAVDLNAVPPAGIGGIDPQDRGAEHDGQICYGALGVGRLKMKLHKAAIAQLFKSNNQVLDAEEISALARRIDRGE